MHDLPLITTIAAGFAFAWVLGLLTHKLRLSPIVGYLLAGVIISPHTPGITGDVHLAHQLAEVGVILLMFGVGLHFHAKDLWAVKTVAIPGAVGQTLVAMGISAALFTMLGMPLNAALVLGLAMAVASTVVLMRVLMDANALNTPQGHVAVGWLIVEDIITIVALVLIPVMGASVGSAGAEALDASAHAAEGTEGGFIGSLFLALAKLMIFVGLIVVLGRRIIPWLMVKVAKLRSRELFTLTVLVFSVAIATGAYIVFGASMALGAFLAGMVVAQSPVSHQAAADALPLRDAFAVLFFVSVGMMFDPALLREEPFLILAGVVVVFIAKPLAALLIVAALGRSPRTALTVAVGLAQIGEFSFIVSDVARKAGLMGDAGQNVLVATAIISITLNPLLFRSLPSVERFLMKRKTLWNLLNARSASRMKAANALTDANIAAHAPDSATRLAIIVGYGPVGSTVDRILTEGGMETFIIDLNADTVIALNRAGKTAIYGDASNQTVLEHAMIMKASHIVVTLPHSADRAAVVTAARHLNPGVRILVRARYLRERSELDHAGANAAIFEEAEAAIALARLVLVDTGAPEHTIRPTVARIRQEFNRGEHRLS